jgi:predicted flap endonuclease-1-like 5' DNA nuclease
MNWLFAFVLGLLIGWLIEWLIDYFYWRRRYADKETIEPRDYVIPEQATSARVEEHEPVVPTPPDDHKLINGNGKVIERRLNDAGVYTFEQLGSLTPADLRKILGTAIERLANEESLLQQARDLARRNR